MLWEILTKGRDVVSEDDQRLIFKYQMVTVSCVVSIPGGGECFCDKCGGTETRQEK